MKKKFLGMLLIAVLFSFSSSISAQDDNVYCCPPNPWGGNNGNGNGNNGNGNGNGGGDQNGNGKSTNFNLTFTVNKYIEVTASPITWDFGTTEHKSGAESLLTGSQGNWELAYANCPFTVTITGSNDAGQSVPRFARAEVGAHANGHYDILPTFFDIRFTTNGVEDQFYSKQWMPASAFSLSKQYAEAPHNGQIHMSINAKVNTESEGNVPVRRTSIDPTFKYDDSADAGVYACKMVVTLAAI